MEEGAGINTQDLVLVHRITNHANIVANTIKASGSLMSTMEMITGNGAVGLDVDILNQQYKRPQMKTSDELREILDDEIKQAGGMFKWLWELPNGKRVNQGSIHVARYKDKPFPPSIAKALGYKKVIMWEKI